MILRSLCFVIFFTSFSCEIECEKCPFLSRVIASQLKLIKNYNYFVSRPVDEKVVARIAEIAIAEILVKKSPLFSPELPKKKVEISAFQVGFFRHFHRGKIDKEINTPFILKSTRNLKMNFQLVS